MTDVIEKITAPAAAGVPLAAHQGGHPPEPAAKDQVTIRMPAEGAYLSVLRTATAGLAAPGASLSCDFTLGDESMTIAVSVLSHRAQPPSRDTFAWTVLSALAGNVDAWVGPGGKVTVLLP